MDKRDYYEVLGLSKGAGDAEIKRAYRRLAKQYHPDHNKGRKDAEARFKEIQEAYDVLSDQEKRGRYDQFGHAGLDPRYAAGPGGGVRWTVSEDEPVDLSDFADVFGFHSGSEGPRDVGSIFEQFFGGRPGSRIHASGTAPARDVEHHVTLSFEEAIRGATLDIEVSDGTARSERAASRAERQRISVRIPPGVHDGQRIRVRGKGQPGSGRRPAGDLLVVCSVRPHPYFRRDGDDIYLDVPISIAEAALGAKVDIPTLDGIRTVTIPPGTSSGAKLRLAGLGAASPKTGQRGDQYAVVKIVAPTISELQRRLLEELARSGLGCPRQGLWR